MRLSLKGSFGAATQCLQKIYCCWKVLQNVTNGNRNGLRLKLAALRYIEKALKGQIYPLIEKKIESVFVFFLFYFDSLIFKSLNWNGILMSLA